MFIYVYPIFGLLAGFIDSIAGGGGLITLPLLALVFGPGVHAIGTNKIVGVSGALIALIVYAKNGHFQFKKGILFSFFIGIGAFLGSYTAPFLPSQIFRILMMAMCPIFLLLILKRNYWMKLISLKQEPMEINIHPLSKKRAVLLATVGLLCGFYDGVFGPGGGTLMLIALLFFGNLPLLSALAISKMANTCSASVGLLTYGLGGFVHWKMGFLLAIGMSLGAYVGARIATHKAELVVKPALVVVVVLLLAKLAYL